MSNSGNHDSRLLKLEQRRQQIEAESSSNDEDSFDYGPHGITMVFVQSNPHTGFATLTKAQQLRVDQVESQLRAEARAARCTQRWHISITFTEDGGLEVSGPPWWPETPKSEDVGRNGFDAARALAAITGVGARRYN